MEDGSQIMDLSRDEYEELLKNSPKVKRYERAVYSEFIRKPKTNADRIRTMTDEELAEKLAIHLGCNMCPGWPVTCEEKCTEYWLKWLKQEIN